MKLSTFVDVFTFSDRGNKVDRTREERDFYIAGKGTEFDGDLVIRESITGNYIVLRRFEAKVILGTLLGVSEKEKGGEG